MPVDFLNPTIVAAFGTLFGVFLTVSTQAVTSSRQRRQERIHELFDRKLELYLEVMQILEESVDAWAATGRVAEELKKKTAELKEVAEIDKEMKEFIETYADENGDLKGDLDASTRQRGSALAKRYQAVDAKRKEVIAGKGSDPDIGEAELERLLASRDALQDLRPRIALLAEERLQSEFVLVLQKILLGSEVKSSHLDGVRYAARRELGMRDRRIIGARHSARRKVALWAFKARNRNQPTVFETLELDRKKATALPGEKGHDGNPEVKQASEPPGPSSQANH